MTDLGLLINNTEMPATGDAVFERHNPISGEVATRAAAATGEDALKAADAAAAAFPGWSHTAPGERRKILWAAGDALEAKIDQFIEAMGAETGATAGCTGWRCSVHAVPSQYRRFAESSGSGNHPAGACASDMRETLLVRAEQQDRRRPDR